MANNYSQFSAMIENVTPEEAEWVETVLGYDVDEGAVEEGEDTDLEKLKKELSLEGDHNFEMWPHFGWKTEGANKCSLWLYSEEGLNDSHLTWFVQAFINKFRPDYIFSVTGAETCSKPRIGEFGGWWLVVAKDQVLGGNTWDAAQAAVAALKTGNFGPEVD